jgi:hypothetical protein
MATPMLRNGLTSPARTMMRPILKRPAALPLSPTTQTSNFSSLMSPSSQKAFGSSHVHFPSSPSKLVSTIGTYSSNAYNRAPISVSPNPVTLPGRGERVYSLTLEGFRLAAAPKMFRSFSMAYQPSPVVTDFEDPRSPKLQPAADVTGAKAANAVRFARTATKQAPKALEEAITSYPRSPYPTATFNQGADAEMETRGRQWPRTSNEISGPARARARAQSIGARQFVRNKKGLTLGGRATPADFTPIPSPLGQSFVPASSVQSTSLNRSNKPAPLALEVDSAGSDQLSNAFWDSVAIDAPSADEPMVTALEYPESAVEFEEKADMEIQSAVQPSLVFAGADGVLFSPGLPKPHSHRVGALRGALEQAMMSPSFKRTSFRPIARKEITAPSPNDPFAAFPSFGAALEMTGVQYPPAVVQIV